MTIRSKFRALIGKTSPFSMEFVVSRGNGSYLFDEENKPYLDLISGIGVSLLGHGHPNVIQAIHDQANLYLHTMVYGEHVQSPQVRLADLLVSQLPPSLNSVFFQTTGAEAIEGAIKLAKKYTGRPQVISFKQAYHGSTYGALSLMSDDSKTHPYIPILPGIKHLNFNDIISLQQIDEHTAAVVMEVIQAEAGIILPVSGFIEAVRDRCNSTGTLLILDEIQTALGRTGSLFAFSSYQIVPDILVLGKSLGGGLPLSAFIADTRIMYTLADDPPLTHMTTFGGHPLSCAAGLACLETILNSNLIEESVIKANLFESLLDKNQIKTLRRPRGFWMALDLGDATRVQQVIQTAIGRGLLMDWFLFNDQSIRIAPPLNILEEEIQFAAHMINQSLNTFNHL